MMTKIEAADPDPKLPDPDPDPAEPSYPPLQYPEPGTGPDVMDPAVPDRPPSYRADGVLNRRACYR